MDADLHGPDIPKMFGVEGMFPEAAGDNKMTPIRISNNLSAISMGFLLESDDQPVIWRGPLKMGAIKQFLNDVTWGDLKEGSIDSARELAALNDVEIEFHAHDLNSFYGNRRFDYIDIDPFGSPVPFIQNAVISLKRNGVLAVTATDSAALTGSVARVARRRYGIESARSHFMQELGARSLLGYVTRIAAAFEKSVEPLFFYTRDHFIRGYVRIGRGAKRADSSLENLGWFDYSYPRSPEVIVKLDSLEGSREGRKTIGPVWTGSLSDVEMVQRCLDLMGKGDLDYLKTGASIEKMLTLSITEDLLPPGGFDINETASLLSMSPPSVKIISAGIEDSGHQWSRSRFSPTQIRTDAPWDIIERIFKEEK